MKPQGNTISQYMIFPDEPVRNFKSEHGGIEIFNLIVPGEQSMFSWS